jgi:hypothetical protein
VVPPCNKCSYHQHPTLNADMLPTRALRFTLTVTKRAPWYIRHWKLASYQRELRLTPTISRRVTLHQVLIPSTPAVQNRYVANESSGLRRLKSLASQRKSPSLMVIPSAPAVQNRYVANESSGLRRLKLCESQWITPSLAVIPSAPDAQNRYVANESNDLSLHDHIERDVCVEGFILLSISSMQ